MTTAIVKSNDPERHHYVPAFYLAGFTGDGSGDTKLWVHDVTSGRVFDPRPFSTGFQRRLYRAEVEAGEDPNVLEHLFSTLENQVAPIIKRIDTGSTLPDGGDFNLLINFIALLFSRVPNFKQLMEHVDDALHRSVLEHTVSSPARFEDVRRRMLAAGYDSAKDMTYEQMKEFIGRGEFEIPLPQSEYHRLLMQGMDSALPPLAACRWSIVRFHDCPDKLICSDNPVNVVWTTPNHPRWASPGLALPGTEVLVPLTRNTLLVGTMGGEETVTNGNRELVARANGRLASITNDCVCQACPPASAGTTVTIREPPFPGPTAPSAATDAVAARRRPHERRNSRRKWRRRRGLRVSSCASGLPRPAAPDRAAVRVAVSSRVHSEAEPRCGRAWRQHCGTRWSDPMADDRRITEDIYLELRRLANAYFDRSGSQTLQPTALVHEAWLRIDKSDSEFSSRDHFMAVAAKAMRHVLVDGARARRTEKRGGGVGRVTLVTQLDGTEDRSFDALALNDALERLAALNERHATLIELRVFGGLTIEECAKRLDVSHFTIEVDWRMARAWLRRELE